MKALLITLIVVGAAVFAIVKLGGVMDFDPADQLAEFKAKAQPGADWTELVESNKPSNYRNYYTDSEGLLSISNELKYREDTFKRNVDEGKFSDGFMLQWVFGAGEVYDVYFDGDGKVESIGEPITTQDLLDGTAVEKMKDM